MGNEQTNIMSFWLALGAKPWIKSGVAFAAGVVATHCVQRQSHIRISTIHDRVILALPGEKKPLVVPVGVYEQYVLQAAGVPSLVRVANQGNLDQSILAAICRRLEAFSHKTA